MDFVLFILVTATLFIRPAEIVEEVAAWPIYWYLILACTVAALQPVLRQLSSESLFKHPITAGMVGMLVAVVASHLAHLETIYAREFGLEFLKIVIYFLLLFATVNTPKRLNTYLFALAVSIITLAAIAVLQYHGYIQLSSMETLTQTSFNPETGLVEIVPRIQATGIYHDPNDLSMIVVLGMMMCLWILGNAQRSPLVLAWLAPLGLLGYTLYLTKSRGGFLGLLAALLTFCMARFGWRKSIPLALVGLPLMFFVFSGRQTGLSDAMENDTGQSRVQLWAESFARMKTSPLFGIGSGMLESDGEHTSHNTFVQTWSELGLVGGTIFCGIYAYCAYSLYRLGAAHVVFFDAEISRLRPYLLAMLGGYGFGMVSLSRAYIAPTYLVPGVVCVFLSLAQTDPPLAPLPLNLALLKRVALVSAALLTFFYLFTRIFARFG